MILIWCIISYLWNHFNFVCIEYTQNLSLLLNDFAACGSRVTSPTGKIRSPFWPGYYPIKRSCSYIIDSASGSNVVLDFMNLNLVKTGTCEDYIQVKKNHNNYFQYWFLICWILLIILKMHIKYFPCVGQIRIETWHNIKLQIYQDFLDYFIHGFCLKS